MTKQPFKSLDIRIYTPKKGALLCITKYSHFGAWTRNFAILDWMLSPWLPLYHLNILHLLCYWGNESFWL